MLSGGSAKEDKLQTNQRHHEEELPDIYSNTPTKRQYEQSNQLSLPRQDDCFVFVCLIWFFTSHQQSFSYKGTGLPGLNQY